MEKVKLAVIGGSGLYDMEGLEVIEQVRPATAWGEPSDSITIGRFSGKKVAFLPRHGRGHFLPPSRVPFRANIAALKMLGVEEIVAFSAVGSLREEIAPRDFVLPTQLIDRTRSRPSTFFDGSIVVHATFGDPFSRPLAEALARHAPVLQGVRLHREKTLVVMEGPAFSTRAESQMYRSWGGDIINMSALPEAKLARELEIQYQMVCMSTDYDSWRVEEEAVTADYIIGNLHANAANAQALLKAFLQDQEERPNTLQGTIRAGIITAPDKRPPAERETLNQLLPDTF